MSIKTFRVIGLSLALILLSLIVAIFVISTNEIRILLLLWSFLYYLCIILDKKYKKKIDEESKKYDDLEQRLKNIIKKEEK